MTATTSRDHQTLPIPRRSGRSSLQQLVPGGTPGGARPDPPRGGAVRPWRPGDGEVCAVLAGAERPVVLALLHDPPPLFTGVQHRLDEIRVALPSRPDLASGHLRIIKGHAYRLPAHRPTHPRGVPVGRVRTMIPCFFSADSVIDGRARRGGARVPACETQRRRSGPGPSGAGRARHCAPRRWPRGWRW